MSDTDCETGSFNAVSRTPALKVHCFEEIVHGDVTWWLQLIEGMAVFTGNKQSM